MTRRTLVALTGLTLCAGAFAQAWPAKPIRLVVPFPPGGGTDIIAREASQRVASATGWTFVIDNKPGAGGTIGTEIAVGAPPDGYTLVFGNNGPNALIQLMRPVPYDPINDLRPVALVALTPMFFAVPADSPAKTLQDFINYFGPDRPCSVSRELSKLFEENARGSLQEMHDHFNQKNVKGEIVIVLAGKE